MELEHTKFSKAGLDTIRQRTFCHLWESTWSTDAWFFLFCYPRSTKNFGFGFDYL